MDKPPVQTPDAHTDCSLENLFERKRERERKRDRARKNNSGISEREIARGFRSLLGCYRRYMPGRPFTITSAIRTIALTFESRSRSRREFLRSVGRLNVSFLALLS